MSEAGSIEDWTEKYRPTSMSQMEGNDSQLRMIAQWLDRWASGKIPDKRGLLLVGPPGVGKTTLAKAVAKERGWSIIELNASEERKGKDAKSTTPYFDYNSRITWFGSRI